MFLITQFIGLYVISSYSPIKQEIVNNETGSIEQFLNYSSNPLPYNMQPPETDNYWAMIPSIIFSFAMALILIFILMKYKWKFFIRLWFFVVVALALGISLNALLKDSFTSAWLLVLLISVPLAYLKVYRPSFIIHNATELFIYPGIAAVFVPIFNVWTVLVLLVIISIYDMWAVWHSGIMQKMAKFQMKEIRVFSGFFIPYMTKKLKGKLKNLKVRGKKGKKIKISLAILGGGDVVFPIITSGVFFVNYSIMPALFVIFGAFAGLAFLFSISQKKKFYPAMPFISGGIFLALLLWFLLF